MGEYEGRTYAERKGAEDGGASEGCQTEMFVSVAKELGAEVNVQNANGDVEEQRRQIDYFIRKGMDAIVTCFIGGASAYGGVGSVAGMVVGATLMGVINQGMSIMGMEANYQKVVKGLVLLIAIVFDVMSKKEKK